MGSVFVARDEVLGREVAVKAIRPTAMEMGGSDRFTNEGRAIAQLTHPNIVRVFDVGKEGGVPYLVMELALGGSLKDRLARAPMSSHEVRGLGVQIALALQAAHERGIVHRDVKPANVLESTPGTWKLADFGIAHVPDASLTMTGQFLGSPVYAAPESIRAGLFGSSSDVYGLGCTLYEAVTGRKPHEGRGLEERLRPDDDSVNVHRAVLAGIDAPGLTDAIGQALAPTPADRPSAAEIAATIARATAASPTPRATTPVPVAPSVVPNVLTVGVADSIVTPPRSATEFVADSLVGAPPAQSRRKMVVVIGAVAAAVILVAVLASRGRREPSAGSAPSGSSAPDATAPVVATDAESPITPGEVHVTTPRRALDEEEAAAEWEKVVKKLYEQKFDDARKDLVEWERSFGATDETRSLHAQLDALPEDAYRSGDGKRGRGRKRKRGD